MAPKINEKQHQSILTQKPFYISAQSLCHNKRLKRKRIRQAEELRAYDNNVHFNACLHDQKINVPKQQKKVRQKRFEKLQADITIDLLSDEEEKRQEKKQRKINEQKNIQILNTKNNERNMEAAVMMRQEKLARSWVGLDVERARILGLMPVSCKPTSLKQQESNNTTNAKRKKRKLRKNGQNGQNGLNPAELCRGPSMPLSGESIILSDDSQDIPQQSGFNVHCECDQDTFLSQNSIQVDEVTVSLVPRSRTTKSCRRSSHCGGVTTPFPMLPDETVVQTVIANRIYELSLDKLREGLANCGVPEFSNINNSKISPQYNRINHFPSPPNTNTGEMHSTPVSLKLSSDLSISLISDDDDDDDDDNGEEMLQIERNLLQKLPLNVSISQINSGRSSKIPKRKLG